MQIQLFKPSLAALALSLSAAAAATPLTETSPLGVQIASGVSKVGGIVIDLQGSNGAHVFAQAAASSLFNGTQTVTNLTIGSITGFTPTVVTALGGGLSGAAIRITLEDGDSESGGFNFNESTVEVDGISFGGVSTVNVERTNALGTTTISSGVGFRNNVLDTGWLTLSSGNLGALYSALADGGLTFVWTDSGLDSNVLDFTQGVDASLINVGTGPVVTPPTGGTVPVPGSLALLGLGLFGLCRMSRKH
jgi:PEP-CTERM motif